MAESLDDGEFWLPPQFLTDDDILMDMTNSNIKKSDNKKKEGFGLETEATKSLFTFEFPYGFGTFGHPSSDLSSPVESVVGSTETESDEEDYIAGLTRQIAHSTLEDDAFASKARFVTGSPQSTLCTVGRACSCRQGSSRGSPNCQSQVSSPPGTWDLLYAAAGEVARMRVNQESYGYQLNRGLLGPPRKPSPISVPLNNHHPNLVDAAGSIFSQRQQQLSLSHQKLQATQFQQLKQQQMMKQKSSSVWGGLQTQSKPNGLYQVGGTNRVMRTNNNTNNGRPLGLSPSAWPPLQHAATQQLQAQQQQNGSGMRAVFLGAPGAKRECAGTGVFLPRRINTPTETRKKSASSTVLLPAKVVQALNLNFDDNCAPFHPRFGGYMPESDAAAALRSRNSNGVSYQKRNLRPQQAMNHEIRLPQEWSY